MRNERGRERKKWKAGMDLTNVNATELSKQASKKQNH